MPPAFYAGLKQTNMSDINQSLKKNNSFLFILGTGLLVGTLDIATAFVDVYIASGSGPEGVLRYIASGVFGNDAFSGGQVMIAWGLFFHFVIAFAFTIFFYWLYPKVRAMRSYPIATGIIYAIFIWAITNRVVVPLSNTPPMGPFKLIRALKAIAILSIMIGLPLSFIMKKHFKNKARVDEQPDDNFGFN